MKSVVSFCRSCITQLAREQSEALLRKPHPRDYSVPSKMALDGGLKEQDLCAEGTVKIIPVDRIEANRTEHNNLPEAF